MDNNELAKWSGSFQGMTSDLKKGGKIVANFLIGKKVRKVKHTLTVYEEGKHFGQSDPLIPGIKDNHHFIVEPISSNECKFIQTDEAKGPMALLMGRYLQKTQCNLYTDFNQKLKLATEQNS